MARKNEYGHYILSAGEIASYSVCPQSWKLNYIDETKSLYTPSIQEGNKLHKEWTKEVDEAMYFTRTSTGLKYLIFVLIILFFTLRFMAPSI